MGAALGFVTALARFTAASQSLAAAIMGAAKSLPMAKLSKSFMDHHLEPAGAGEPLRPGAGDIVTSGVTFGYGDSPILRDVSLRIDDGAFVGMVGLEAPHAGEVFLDGADRRKMDRQQISGAIGLVTQDGRPLSGPVLSSIRGIRDVTIEQAWELARSVGLDADLRALPMGIHTVLGYRGAGFSAAQIQRLRIARALAARPRILAMDESFSAIAPEDRRSLLGRIPDLGVTRLVVSHEMSTLAKANRILLVEGGEVVDCTDNPGIMRRDVAMAV